MNSQESGHWGHFRCMQKAFRSLCRCRIEDNLQSVKLWNRSWSVERTGSLQTRGRAETWSVRCICLLRLLSTMGSTCGPIWSGWSRSSRIRRMAASCSRIIFCGLIRFRTGSGREREAAKNKGKTASDTDIIRLWRRFCYTSLFFTLTTNLVLQWRFGEIQDLFYTLLGHSLLCSFCWNTQKNTLEIVEGFLLKFSIKIRYHTNDGFFL